MAADVLTKVKRYPQRASYDKELLLDILKNGFACHVAFQVSWDLTQIPGARTLLPEELLPTIPPDSF